MSVVNWNAAVEFIMYKTHRTCQNCVVPVYLTRNTAMALLMALETLTSSGDVGSKKRFRMVTKTSN